MITFKIKARHEGAHVRVKIWAGRNPGSLGLTGELIMRAEEWPSFRACFTRSTNVQIDYTPPE